MFSMKRRRGIILGVVILVFMVLGVFIFAYHSMVRSQNIRAHHELIGEVAAQLALTGVHLLSAQISADFRSIVEAAAPTLLSSPAVPPTISVGTGHPICQALLADYNRLLQQLTELRDASGIFSEYPVCREMDITFENIRMLASGTDAIQFQAGRDPVEKEGEVAIACSVEYHGLVRRAVIRRQFRCVNMVPGAFARFSLFVPFTPWIHSYNSLGVKFDGTVDFGYTHPPSSSFAGPLKVFNGTDSFTLGVAPNDEGDLRSRGWIFLGPSFDGVTGPLVLKIPGGYKSDAGGHFMFSIPPGLINISGVNYEVVPPEEVVNPAHFNLTPGVATFSIGGKFQGYYTYEVDEKGAAGNNVWPGLTQGAAWNVNDRWLCASSWLFPFGDRAKPSRTLMVGPVLAGFLKMYFMKDTTTNPELWKGIIRGVPDPAVVPGSYDPTAVIQSAAGGFPLSLTYESLFLQPTPPDLLRGFTSLARVMPYNSTPDPTIVPPSAGVPFNVFFDFMRYPGIGAPFPELHEGTTLGDGSWNGKPFFVPSADKMRPLTGIKGLHPFEDFRVLFTKDGGADPNTSPDNVYFCGDLTKLTINDHNLLSRVTNIIDLTDCADLADEGNRLRDQLFAPTTAAHSLGTGWWQPRRSGIFLIRRKTAQPLPLPGKIALDKSLIIIFNDGDLVIPDEIKSPLLNGAPEFLLTLVSLKGDIVLKTAAPICAYLVALWPGNPANGGAGGGRLLSSGVAEMNVFGGVAVWEMGLYRNGQPEPRTGIGTTMSNFPRGGNIFYNPRFNPSAETYPRHIHFIMEDRPSQILVTGGA
jgi:hypothetical protein